MLVVHIYIYIYIYIYISCTTSRHNRSLSSPLPLARSLVDSTCVHVYIYHAHHLHSNSILKDMQSKHQFGIHLPTPTHTYKIFIPKFLPTHLSPEVTLHQHTHKHFCPPIALHNPKKIRKIGAYTRGKSSRQRRGGCGMYDAESRDRAVVFSCYELWHCPAMY